MTKLFNFLQVAYVAAHWQELHITNILLFDAIKCKYEHFVTISVLGILFMIQRRGLHLQTWKNSKSRESYGGSMEMSMRTYGVASDFIHGSAWKLMITKFMHMEHHFDR